MTSFNVTWKTGKPTTGKAFAKRRKPSNDANTTASKPKRRVILNKGANKLIDESKRQDTEIKQRKMKLEDKSKTKNLIFKNKISDEPDTMAINKITTRPKTVRDVTENIPTFNEKSFDSSTTFIKRKQKKDKIAAKLAAKEGNSLSAQNYNVNNNVQMHSLFSVGHKDVYVTSNKKGKSLVEKVFSVGKNFGNLGIHKYIVSNLEKNGFTTLTTVQEKSIPVILSGKNVLIRSQTGSGKTLAYAVPILDALQGLDPRVQRSDGVQAIIIVPTRELALQTHEIFGKINTFQWIVVGHLCGGENRNTEKTRLRKGVHILIATPGRLLDHLLHTAAFKINNVRCLVLDEADRLLDMGFKKDIVRIVEELDNSKTNAEYNPMDMLRGKKTPDEQQIEAEADDIQNTLSLRNPTSKFRQTVLLSATLSKGVADLADFTMKEHIYIDALDESSQFSDDLMVMPNTVQQKFIVTHVKHRLFTLSAMLIAQSKKPSKVFVFMGTSTMVDYHYELFTRFLAKMPVNRGKLKSGDVVLLEHAGDDSDDDEEDVLKMEFFKLHGSMDQSARKDVFTRFRAAKTGVLFCTDVVSRGIDVPTADCIIQYNGPQSVEDYLHRVGRTGRAGKSGTSYVFLTHEEQDFVTKLAEHKVFLQEQDPEEFLKQLGLVMEEEDVEKAASALQKRYENALSTDANLHRLACLAYSSWSRFYNTYSSKMRSIFDFKKANLGHYVTSFGLRETPTDVSKILRKQIGKTERPKFNKKLTIHQDNQQKKPMQKRKIKSVSLTTSEFSSGLKPTKKKKKKMEHSDI